MAPKSSQAKPAKPSPAEIVALQESLVKRLIQSGEWDRISSILKDRLAESGWTDETFHQAKEHARQQNQLHFQSIMSELVPKAEANVPEDVKEEVLALIRAFVEENTTA